MSVTGRYDSFIVAYDPRVKAVTAAFSPQRVFGDLPSVGYDDGDFLRTPYLVIPRLQQLGNWLIQPSKNTNWFLYWGDSLLQILTKLRTSMIVGDGIQVTIYKDTEWEEVDEDLTDVVREWLLYPCGKSPDNRGFTLDNFVIPLILIDNLTCGGSAWYQFFGIEGKTHPDEIGELMIKWLDPRSYATVRHDIWGWFKLMQFRTIQPLLPNDRETFDTIYAPAIRSAFGHISGTGPISWIPPINIRSEEFYWFNLFLRPPVGTIVQALISKIVLSFLRDKFVEKAIFPFYLIKVPRHAIRDASNKKFQEKLDYVAKIISEFRSGDAIGVEGEEYTPDGVVISKGWQVDPMSLDKISLEFASMFRQLNEEIAWGVYMSLAAISPTGALGQTTHLATGGVINANIILDIKSNRKGIAQVLSWIFRDVIEHKRNKEISLRQIQIEFSKIREEDAALFLNILNSYRSAGALETNEMRKEGERLGLKLPEMPLELTTEGQTQIQMQLRQGLDDSMLKETPIPDIFTAAPEVTEEDVDEVRAD